MIIKIFGGLEFLSNLILKVNILLEITRIMEGSFKENVMIM